MAFQSCTSTPDLFDSFLASPPKNKVLRQLKTLIDWGALRQTVAPAYKWGGPGAEGYDPVLLIKMLLLQRLYQLSDPAVVEEAADRLSFREFLDLRASDSVPDDTTLVKFRGRLRNYNLFDAVVTAIEQQLADKGYSVREGAIKLVDATLIQAAVRPPRIHREVIEEAEGQGRIVTQTPPLDQDADWGGKKDKMIYGYKLHMAQDRATGLIACHAVTPASVNDTNEFESLLTGEEAEVMADKGYDSGPRRKALEKQGIKASIMKRAARGKPLSAWWTGRNKSIGRVRGFIEGGFATLKRYLGCGRARYRGLDRVYEQLTWGIVMFNLRRVCALARA
jgi:IS5 family transposase